MTNVIRLKRRASAGSAGAPATLASAEPAFNENDLTLYYGSGDNGSGVATSVIAIGGKGAFADLSSTQTIGGAKTFSISPTVPTPSTSDSSTAAATTAFVKNQAYATLASPSLTGSPTAPTLAVDTNTTGIATAAFVLGQAGTATPIVDGVGAAGTSTRWSRQDHVHPTDTSRAALASPTFTGVPAGPTPANGTNTTQLATTAFVLASRLDQLASATSPISGVDPTLPAHLATKNYVDNAIQGLDAKQEVEAATTANITLSGTQTVDGVALTAGQSVLVKNQTTAAQNGIYTVAAGAWSRRSDVDAWNEYVGAFTFVTGGTTNGSTGWLSNATAGGTLGTTNIGFVQFSGAGSYTAGNGLTLAGTQFAVAGTTNRISVSGSGVDISAGYAGQTSITLLGTVSTGVWQGTAIDLTRGGAGQSLTGLATGAMIMKTSSSTLGAAVAGTDYLSPNSMVDGGTF